MFKYNRKIFYYYGVYYNRVIFTTIFSKKVTYKSTLNSVLKTKKYLPSQFDKSKTMKLQAKLFNLNSKQT